MAPRQDGAELQRTESFQYPAGHLNHLNDGQLKTLEQFKEIAKQKGYWTPSSAKEPASHDDETLLRYLRARKFVPGEAFKQFKETEDWRSENELDKLYETIDIDDYDQSRRLYPQWIGRRDKRGIPVYVFEVSHLDSKALAAYQSNTSPTPEKLHSNVPPKMLRLFALYENLCRFVLPLCSAMPNRQHPETPISQSSNIVDISGVSLMQFWKLKNHMQDASVLATAHYPETLDRIFLLGAPSFFPTVWNWVKKWFDPITVSKIFVLSQKETLPTLVKFIDIENIPKKYGGKLDFTFGDLPKIDPEIASQLKWTEAAKPGVDRSIPTGPVRWQYGATTGDLEAVAVGTRKGAQRHDVIAGVHPDTKIAQMSLSPGRVQKAVGGNNNAAATKSASAVNGSAPAPAAAVNSSTSAAASNDSHPAPAAAVNNSTSAPASNNSHPAPAAAVSNSTSAPASNSSHPAPAAAVNNSTSTPTAATAKIGGPALGKDPGTSIAAASSDLPYRDHWVSSDNNTSNVRQGTSSTRYEQQAQTHAHGNAGAATPSAARDGHGEKQAIVEPTTVGQAPKEYPVPDTSAPPTMIEQAQHTAEAALQQAQHTAEAALQQATQAGHSVLAAVGLGGKKEEEEPVKEMPQHDPAIDNMDGRNVEEYLRGATMTASKH